MNTPSLNQKETIKGEFILKQKETSQPNLPTSQEYSINAERKAVVKYVPSPFTSFCEYPARIAFKYQENGEEIILLIRKHFITNLPWILSSLLLFPLPPLAIFLLPILLPLIDISPMSLLAFSLFYYLVLFGFVLTNFSVWYFHVAFVTNKRIIDVDIHGILFRNVAQTKIELIQDVSYTQNGVIRSLFDYGDVFVQTAGTELNFEFDQAPNPARIIRTIGQLIGKPKQ